MFESFQFISFVLVQSSAFIVSSVVCLCSVFAVYYFFVLDWNISILFVRVCNGTTRISLYIGCLQLILYTCQVKRLHLDTNTAIPLFFRYWSWSCYWYLSNRFYRIYFIYKRGTWTISPHPSPVQRGLSNAVVYAKLWVI